jgi:hypothetical protein
VQQEVKKLHPADSVLDYNRVAACFLFFFCCLSVNVGSGLSLDFPGCLCGKCIVDFL